MHGFRLLRDVLGKTCEFYQIQICGENNSLRQLTTKYLVRVVYGEFNPKCGLLKVLKTGGMTYSLLRLN